MRVKDFTARYGLDHNDFVQFMKDNNLSYDTSLKGYIIPDAQAGEYRNRYMDFCEKRKMRIIAERQRFLLTTAPTLDHYIIENYYGLVEGHGFFHTGYFGKQVTQLVGTAGDERSSDLGHVTRSYIEAEANALQKMKSQALALGANAVLSIQQNTTDAGGVVCITLRGTAVTVEKGEWPKNSLKSENLTFQSDSEEVSSSSSSTLAQMRPRDELHETNPYVDQDICIGCEQCVDICPELFQMKAGKAIVLSDMTMETWIKGNEAIANCPVGAIKET